MKKMAGAMALSEVKKLVYAGIIYMLLKKQR